MFFDTHVHFDDFVDDGSFEAVLDRAVRAGVDRMLAVGGSPSANECSLALAERCAGQLFSAVGYDRHLAESACDFAALRRQVQRPEVVAVGEIGLDYFYESETAREQKHLFEECLQIANEVGKPVVIHTRDADSDSIGMLTDFARAWRHDPARIGVIHCYTRDAKMMKVLLDLGFMISMSGIVTFRTADSVREVAKQVPSDRLLIETDSPYLAPVPHRGARCEPAWVAETAALLAALRGVSLEALAAQTHENARTFLSV